MYYNTGLSPNLKKVEIMEDKQFVNQFATILAILVTITVLLIIVAKYLHSAHYETDLAMVKSMEKRLAPIGKVNIGEAPAIVPKSQTDQEIPQKTAMSVMDAKTAYDTVCAACHNAGIANAPIYGDKAVWELRLAAGIDVLYASSLNGKGAMPAKGGRVDLSDETIKQAVDYMLKSVQ